MTATVNSHDITRHNLTMAPDGRRVVVKLFVPGEDARITHNRASCLIERVLQLDESDITTLLDDVLNRFASRHHDILSVFQHHYEVVQHRVPAEIDLSPSARTLIGAYFSHEFSVEAAALCNPSMVPHPDQGDLAPGEMRAALSLRQIGEGHISSIGFCSVVLGPGSSIRMEDRDGPLTIGHRVGAKHMRHQLFAALGDEDVDNEASAYILNALPERYDDQEFEDILGHLPAELQARPTTPKTMELIRRIVGDDYAVTFPATTPLHQRVLWPATPSESRGMEDARFVQVVESDGRPAYQATYTAYDGFNISGRV